MVNHRRGVLVGLIVRFIASAGVASRAHTPVLAFVLSAACVLVVVTVAWLF